MGVRAYARIIFYFAKVRLTNDNNVEVGISCVSMCGLCVCDNNKRNTAAASIRGKKGEITRGPGVDDKADEEPPP